MTSLIKFPFAYIYWHFCLAWADIVRLYLNLSWFLWNYFSLNLLISTLFSPWRRIKENKDANSAGIIGSLIMNFILRIVGFMIRTATISAGLLSLLVFNIFFAVIAASWIFLPAISLLLIYTGLTGLI